MSLLTQFYNCPSNGGGGGGTYSTAGNDTGIQSPGSVQNDGGYTIINYFGVANSVTAGNTPRYWLGSADNGETISVAGSFQDAPKGTTWNVTNVGGLTSTAPIASRNNGSFYMVGQTNGTTTATAFGDAGFLGLATSSGAPTQGPFFAFYVNGTYGTTYYTDTGSATILYVNCRALGGSGGATGVSTLPINYNMPSVVSCRGDQAVYIGAPAFYTFDGGGNLNPNALFKSTNGTTWTNVRTVPNGAGAEFIAITRPVAGKWGTNNLIFPYFTGSVGSGYYVSTNDGTTTTFVAVPALNLTPSSFRVFWSESKQAYYFAHPNGVWKTVDATGAGGVTPVTVPAEFAGASYFFHSNQGVNDYLYAVPYSLPGKGYIARFAL
jgi:hypothetical protein